MSIYAFSATILATRSATTQNSLVLYPNPASSLVWLPPHTLGSAVVVYDLAGRIRLQISASTSNALDVSTLPTGLYQVRAGAAVGKLTIE